MHIKWKYLRKKEPEELPIFVRSYWKMFVDTEVTPEIL